MFRSIFKHHFGELHKSDDVLSPERYVTLRRKIVLLMAVVSILPLIIMGAINYYEYQVNLTREIQNPLRALLSKSKNSYELFLAERTSAVSFIASAYSYEELADDMKLNRIFQVMSREFPGFIDLGLICSNGTQVSYAGPYDIRGKNYYGQDWLVHAQVEGKYLSDVFMGFRKFPHLVIAVHHTDNNGKSWVVRATLDTKQFDKLIMAMSLEPESDAFLLNRQGVLQTNSNYYGKVLDKFPMPMPPVTYETHVTQTFDSNGRDVFLAYTYIPDSEFALMAVKPRSSVFKTWYMVRGDLLFIFGLSVVLIFSVVYRLTRIIIKRMQESEERRELAFREVEHTQKLSSIGRLAAGVAHEINNPLAIINEKAGLMKDILELRGDFPDKDKFRNLADAIVRSVIRCRGITQRMLGFARRMDVHIENLNVNEVLSETIGFLEQEAVHRSIAVSTELHADLPEIESDRGQLQQVFLNILNNALAAVTDGGKVDVRTAADDGDRVSITIRDNGCGMSEDTLNHIFEPFFTTKKGKGTGLGLSITYGIVKRLGGDIAVESKLGAGTTFTVRLPRKNTPGNA